MNMEKLHSKNFTHGKFAAHGHLELWPEDGIWRFEVNGPCNLEGIAALGRMRFKTLEKFPPTGRPYALLGLFHNSMLMPHEAVDRYRADLQAAFRQKLQLQVAEAWIVSTDIEGADMMFPILQKINQEVGIELESFTEFDPAIAWLQAR